MKIGLVGNGFVGNAVYQNLKQKYNFSIYDTNPDKATAEHVGEVCQDSRVIFVALPTPMQKSGKCDLSIIQNAMRDISRHYNNNIIVLKSTVPPGTCRQIKQQHKNLRIVFSPEFLTEANYVEDFKTCNRMIFGGDIEDTSECVRLLSSVFPDKYYVMTNWETAEMVKYFINTFLATKVCFANEMKEICDSIGIQYNEVKNFALLDNRIGKSHLMVPGPDGNNGFGGTCFPKDINAMIHFAKERGINPTVLHSAWEKNLEIRENKDWLTMFGRAVSSDTR
tara:strand:- start:3500 stop:4339 length:840 start_codon:yes stop_codon:yes gene_type:complete